MKALDLFFRSKSNFFKKLIASTVKIAAIKASLHVYGVS